MYGQHVNSLPFFHLYKTGKLTVIGFDGKHLADPDVATDVRDSLLELLKCSPCQLLAVDLMEVELVSSWILGILAAVHQSGINVQLYHPNAHLQEVLETTRLDSILPVRESLTN
jgi:anti-anti-sigma regulatory factor